MSLLLSILWAAIVLASWPAHATHTFGTPVAISIAGDELLPATDFGAVVVTENFDRSLSTVGTPMPPGADATFRWGVANVWTLDLEANNGANDFTLVCGPMCGNLISLEVDLRPAEIMFDDLLPSPGTPESGPGMDILYTGPGAQISFGNAGYIPGLPNTATGCQPSVGPCPLGDLWGTLRLELCTLHDSGVCTNNPLTAGQSLSFRVDLDRAASIPEPSTVLLLASGLGMLAARRAPTRDRCQPAPRLRMEGWQRS